MKKLHLLMLRSFLPPLAGGFGISLFVLVLQFLGKYRDDIFGKGFSTAVILELLSYAALTLVVIALALGVLFSSLMCMGRMGELYELAALKSAGISLYRILLPMGAAGVVLTALAFVQSFWVDPWAKLKLYTMLTDAKKAKPSFALKPGMFNDLIDGYVIRVGSRSPNGMLYEMMVYDHTQVRGNNKLIVADSGRMDIGPDEQYLQMQFYAGAQYEEQPPGLSNAKAQNHRPQTTVLFDTLYYRIDLRGLEANKTDERTYRNHHMTLNMPRLTRAVDSLVGVNQRNERRLQQQATPNLRMAPVPTAATPVNDTTRGTEELPVRTATAPAGAVTPTERAQLAWRRAQNMHSLLEVSARRQLTSGTIVRKYQYEWHLKMALPLAVLVFLSIGAPLGAIIRKGGIGPPVVVCVGFFVLFYVLMTQGKKLGQEGVIAVWLGGWLPILFLVPLAVLINIQSATDSRLLDLTQWRWPRSVGRLLRRPRWFTARSVNTDKAA